MFQIETRQLQCFVAVAKELHFNRAAMRLNMTQPPLSRQIQQLEKYLGCKLFVRTSRSVVLTSAGESLYADAVRILGMLESAASTVRDVSNGSRGRLRCGFTAASAYRFLPGLVRQIDQSIPGASLILKEMVSDRQIQGLRNAELDLGLLRPPIDSAEFDSVRIAQESMVMALPIGHPLAAKSCIEWEDLNGLDMIMYDNEEARYFSDLVTGKLNSAGVYPRNCQQVTQIHTMLSLVRAAIGVAMVPESASGFESAEIEWRPFASGELTAELYFGHL